MTEKHTADIELILDIVAGHSDDRELQAAIERVDGLLVKAPLILEMIEVLREIVVAESIINPSFFRKCESIIARYERKE